MKDFFNFNKKMLSAFRKSIVDDLSTDHLGRVIKYDVLGEFVDAVLSYVFDGNLLGGKQCSVSAPLISVKDGRIELAINYGGDMWARYDLANLLVNEIDELDEFERNLAATYLKHTSEIFEMNKE
ncbi:hypothetical protein [Cypionkella sp. TWP1-2-1b2]|uniref:hypothetical protein n=1 Tax=Cypionkella sp. TWP1-2-1b2 TaxID=2804675 RepID=UPI003CF2A1B3